MEKNEFLLYNDILYQLNRCQTMEDLKTIFLPQLRLLIPFTHGSYISIARGEEDGELIHTLRFWHPDSFREVEEIWIKEYRQAYTSWLSHTAESLVIRDSDLMEGDKRFSTHFYQGLFKQLGVRDTMQMNVVSDGQVLGRIALFRTDELGDFTKDDAFYLWSLSNHIGLVFARCGGGRSLITQRDAAGRLAKTYGLTRREEEVLAYILTGMPSEEAAARLCVTKNTLFKHSQNLYRKCGVKSRWELLSLLLEGR